MGYLKSSNKKSAVFVLILIILIVILVLILFWVFFVVVDLFDKYPHGEVNYHSVEDFGEYNSFVEERFSIRERLFPKRDTAGECVEYLYHYSFPHSFIEVDPIFDLSAVFEYDDGNFKNELSRIESLSTHSKALGNGKIIYCAAEEDKKSLRNLVEFFFDDKVIDGYYYVFDIAVVDAEKQSIEYSFVCFADEYTPNKKTLKAAALFALAVDYTSLIGTSSD